MGKAHQNQKKPVQSKSETIAENQHSQEKASLYCTEQRSDAS
jgi:hypothetical protein